MSDRVEPIERGLELLDRRILALPLGYVHMLIDSDVHEDDQCLMVGLPARGTPRFVSSRFATDLVLSAKRFCSDMTS